MYMDDMDDMDDMDLHECCGCTWMYMDGMDDMDLHGWTWVYMDAHSLVQVKVCDEDICGGRQRNADVSRVALDLS